VAWAWGLLAAEGFKGPASDGLLAARRFCSLGKGAPPSFAWTVRSCRSSRSRRTKVLRHLRHLKGRSLVSVGERGASQQRVVLCSPQYRARRRDGSSSKPPLPRALARAPPHHHRPCCAGAEEGGGRRRGWAEAKGSMGSRGPTYESARGGCDARCG